MERPKLGSRIRARDRLYRKVYEPKNMQEEFRWIPWRDAWPWTKPKPVKGIYVGYRFLQNGHMHYGYDDSSVWVRGDGLEAWLIVEDPRRNPVHVLPEDVINGRS